MLRLYREQYAGFNVRHFHQIARREHGITVSYSFVKQTLQAAGLVKKYRARGRHRLRREPRACLGEMLHLDGSVHEWFMGEDLRPCLIAVSDDATKRVLHAALYPSESTWAVMTSLGAVLRAEGLPMALYMDRAHWAFHTPKAKGPVDKTHLTQVAAPWPASGSSTSRRIRRRRAAGVSGSIARSRIVWSTSCASPASRRSTAANRYLGTVRAAAQCHVQPRAARSRECLRAAGRGRSRRHSVSRGAAGGRPGQHRDIGGRVLQIAAQPRRSCPACPSSSGSTSMAGIHSRGTQQPGTFHHDGRPMEADRDRGTPRDVTPPTPPGIRVRTTAVRPVEPSLRLEVGQAERVEVNAGQCPAQRRRDGHAPRSTVVAGREDRTLRVDASFPQLSETSAGSLPLFPHDGPKPPANPFVKTPENRWRLAEAKVGPPPEHVRSQFLHHLAQAHTTHPSGERPDSCSSRTDVLSASRRFGRWP